MFTDLIIMCMHVVLQLGNISTLSPLTYVVILARACTHSLTPQVHTKGRLYIHLSDAILAMSTTHVQ